METSQQNKINQSNSSQDKLQNSQSGNQSLNTDDQKQFSQCKFHPCRSKYFCVEQNCQAKYRSACGECYTEQPHHLHKIIQQDEYEQILKQNYQKVQQQYGTIETTHTLIQKVKKQYQQLKTQVVQSLDQAEAHVIREIQSQQDNYETEQFKTLNLRIKQLKQNFFYGGCAAFDKTIGDFSLKLYNLDEQVLNYIQQVKKEREQYYQNFQDQFNTITKNIDQLISSSIAPIFNISPNYPQNFQTEQFQGCAQNLEGSQGKPNIGVKFIHNSDSSKNQQLDSKDQKFISSYQNFILTCSMDKTIRLWNLGQDGHEEFEGMLWKTYQFEKKTITSLSQVTYEDFVTGSDDGYIQVWRVADGACKNKFSHFDSQNIQIDQQYLSQSKFNNLNSEQQEQLNQSNDQDQLQLHGVSFIRTINETAIIAGYNDGIIRIWDIQNGIILRSYNFNEPIPQTKFELQLRSVKDICKISQWDFACEGQIYKQDDQQQQNQIYQNSQQENEEDLELVNSQQPKQQKSVQYQVIVYNWQNNQQIQSYNGHSQMITALTKMPQNLMVSASIDGQIHIWNYLTCDVQQIIKQENNIAIRQLIKLSDEIFATGNDDLVIQFWNLNQEQPIKEFNQLQPKTEEEIQIQSQKPNKFQFLLRISETQLVSGTYQSPYLQVWK